MATSTPTLADLQRSLSDRVSGAGAGRVLVAIDGADGSGKTTFADRLAQHMLGQGRDVLRISADDFHSTRADRYRRGRQSPTGYWLDSYNYPQLKAYILDPLSPRGTGLFTAVGHDLRADRKFLPSPVQASADAVVLIDGMFLHRDEIFRYWDISVFLDVPFAVTAARMAKRDGSVPDPSHPSMNRYVEGQKIYFRSCDPAVRATIAVENSDPQSPRLITADQASYRH